MAVTTKILLSGSTDGLPIPVAATATPGTTIHTCGAVGMEDLYLWASNVTGAAATLTLEWGGVTDPGNHLIKAYSIPANSGRVPLVFGEPLQNSKVVKAFSGTASAINIGGYVYRHL